jgi:hypothetical protein
MLRRQHASGSCRLVLLLLLGVDAQFPFGDPPPPPAGPPPGMGELLSEVQLLEDPQQLKELIGSPVVSLILFTEGEEETLETQWFMFFSTVVEKSIDVAAGDARVNWGMADNAKLRKSSACVVQPRESRSRSTHSLPCLRRYYDVHPREQDALHSSSPRTHVHTCLLIIYSFSSCSCVCACACACVCVCVHRPYQVRQAGIWLFCDASDASGMRLPMKVLGEPDTRAAATWILGALDAAKAERVDGIWRKATPPGSATRAGSARPAESEQEKTEL